MLMCLQSEEIADLKSRGKIQPMKQSQLGFRVFLIFQNVATCSVSWKKKICTDIRPVLCVTFQVCYTFTCSFWYISTFIALTSSNCCRRLIRVSCFSCISFSSNFIASSISCFIPTWTISSFSISYKKQNKLFFMISKEIMGYFHGWIKYLSFYNGIAK